MVRSWVAPADAVRDGDWARIEELAKEAASIAVGSS
jgi:2-dehydro-3-deoxyphosphogluconate aldolase/(4S)-4-hydroxy-2-oxoglutarate aldolase